MSYQIIGKTPVNNLLDLDSYDSGSTNNRYPEKSEERQMPNLQKYLRGDTKSQHINGVNGSSSSRRNVSFLDENYEIAPPHMGPSNGMGPMGYGGGMNMSDRSMISVEGYAEPEPVPPIPTTPVPINCPQVFDHIHNCPICSKFYNSDRTVYIVTIVLLSLVCIILLKRVLEK